MEEEIRVVLIKDPGMQELLQARLGEFYIVLVTQPEYLEKNIEVYKI